MYCLHRILVVFLIFVKFVYEYFNTLYFVRMSLIIIARLVSRQSTLRLSYRIIVIIYCILTFSSLLLLLIL